MKQISKTRRLLSCLLALLMIISVVPVMSVSAETTGKTSDGFEYEIIDGEVTITGYEGSVTELAIPSQIDGLSVTTIGWQALFRCESLVTLNIPASVKSIDPQGIWDCKSLKTINVNADSKYFYSIDGVMFSKEDKSLVRYPEGKEDSEYNVPDGTLSIGDNAFSTYYSWDGWEYNSCQNLESVVIPYSVTTIGEDAFARCTSLKSVYIDDNVSEIKQGAFCDCFALEDVVLPEGITKIAATTFVNCKNLKEIKIPSGVKELGTQAFGSCKMLTSVEIPEGVTKIVYAFPGCYALKSVILPKSIIDISGAFSFCSELTDIYYADTQEAWNKVEGAASESLANVTIHFNYCVSTEPEPTEPIATMPADEPVTGGYALGDSNEDGKVNVKDATQIQKAVAGLITLPMVGRNMADVDSNGKVNIKDATAIQKWVAGIDTGFEIGK